jgi:CheY-like chemotaxis protein
MLGIFVDDGSLPGTIHEYPECRVVGPFPEGGFDSLDNWFVQRLLPTLQGLSEDAEPIYFVQADFKFNSDARRCFHFGLQVIEHIRFTRILSDRIRYAPAVLYSFEPSWRLAAKAEHPLLLPGSGLAFARIPEHLASVADPSSWPRWRKAAGTLNAQRMRVLLNPGEALGGSELYQHSYRNLAGAGKFCWEFAGDVLGPENEILRRLRAEEIRDRKMKRLLAALPDLSSGEPPEPQERTDFLRTCKALQFLVVDDEHDKGWSLGLYAGICGQSLAPGHYESLCRASEEAGIGQSGDGLMRVISRPEVAFDLLAQTRKNFNTKLGRWAKAFDAWDQAEPALSNAKATNERVERSFRQSVRSCDEAWAAARDRRDKAEIEFQKSTDVLDKFMREQGENIAGGIYDALPSSTTSDLKLLEVGKLRLLAGLTTAVDACNQARLNREQAVEAMLAQEAARKNLESERANAQEGLQKAERARDNAKSFCLECLRALEGAVPFGAVFLDLRLKPSEDERLPAARASGMRILEQLRSLLPSIPVVVMTASEKALSLEEALAAGASGYWIKGVSTGAKMREIMRRALLRASLAPLWAKIQQVQTRSYLDGKNLNPAQTGFESFRITSQRDLDVIRTLLQDCFVRLWEGDLGPALLDLYAVLEVRYQIHTRSAADRAKDIWTGKTGIEGLDNNIRWQRRDVAHPVGTTPGSGKPVPDLLRHTLEQLLRDPS